MCVWYGCLAASGDDEIGTEVRKLEKLGQGRQCWVRSACCVL